MNTFTNASMPLKLFGVVLALALVAVAALLVTPTSAQSPTNTYANPQPCGPGPDTLAPASMDEPHERTTGHYALFDAYWERTEPEPADLPGQGGEQANTGVLHTNLCPPLVTHTTQGLQTVTTLSASGVDVDELIIHVENDSRQVTVAAADQDDPNSEHLSLAQYPKVDVYADAGDQVWWLRLEDPNLAGDQKSDLTLGFSTQRFDTQYWTEVRYEFRLERNPGIDADEHPHLLAYRARESGVDEAELVWDSAKVGATPVEMAPGVLINDLQWIFTKAGTYEIYVQPVGYVRDEKPAGAGDDWKAISANDTEPGEVVKYTIHVGPLSEVEPPRLGVSRSVPENSPAGTNVGDPFLVFSEASDLGYSLSGDGHENFVVATTNATDPYTIQIKVAEGASLDYETKSTYDLTLGVTNKVDHESNPDPSLDDTLVVRISLEDQGLSVWLTSPDTSPRVGGSGATISADVREAPTGSTPTFTWYSKTDQEDDWTEVREGIDPIRNHEILIRRNVAVTDSYRVSARVGTVTVWSNVVTLHWRAAE